MPSFLHEALVELLRARPGLLAYLLRGPSLPTLPTHDQIISDSADLGTALSPELAADGVARVEHLGQTILAIVFEVQLAIDPRKHFSWPSYLVAARARHRCDAMLIVVSPYNAVAKWAREPIALGPSSGFVQPIVIGPQEMPTIANEARALEVPELAVLSAVAHGHDDDPHQAATIACAAFAAALSFNDHRAEVYYDLIKAALSDAAKEALAMIPQNYQFQDEGLRKAHHSGLTEGEAIGISKGEAIGISKGEAIGISKGEAIGEAIGISKGLIDAVLDTLETRGLSVSANELDLIRACRDPSILRRWHRRAITASCVADVIR